MDKDSHPLDEHLGNIHEISLLIHLMSRDVGGAQGHALFRCAAKLARAYEAITEHIIKDEDHGQTKHQIHQTE